jgi:hypothetical protein
MAIRKFLFLCLSALSISTAAIAGDADFTIVNSTGYVIDELYVSPNNSQSWGNDILGDGILANRQWRNITFNKRNTQCIYDVRIVFDDQSDAIWEDFDLCTIHKITLKYNRSNGQTTAIFE